MHDYLLSTEIVRFAFMFGVAVSMLLYERRHLTTGSIVVPGYIAMFIVYPLVIVATFLNALISYALINKVLRRWFLLYGRTKVTIMAVISILIQTAMLKLSPSGAWLWESDFKLIVGVGYVVPALIAHDMGRQGIKKTTKSVMLAAAIVATPIVVALAFDLPGVNDLAPLQGGGDMAIDAAWIPIAVLLSAAAAWGVAHNYQLRSGGFVGAAFVGMMLGDPWQVVMVACVALVTYFVVTQFLWNSMILFGRRKFSSMLLVASSLSWILLWIGSELFGTAAGEHLDLGSLALTPLFIPGLLANDMQRTSPRRVVTGAALATSFVLPTTWWIQSLFEGLSLAIGWKVLAAVSFVAIFWKQLAPSKKEERAGANDAEIAVAEIATTDGAIGVGHAADAAAPGWEPDIQAVPAFGREGFERWAARHHEAALAAERWLASMLGEVLDAAPAVAPTAVGDGEVAPERPTARIRRAAIAARDRVRGDIGLAPLPRRRSRSGEFDSVATQIAASVGRPSRLDRRQNVLPEPAETSLPRRDRGATQPTSTPIFGGPHAIAYTLGGLPRRHVDAVAVDSIFEAPSAAHQGTHGAPGAPDTPTTADSLPRRAPRATPAVDPISEAPGAAHQGTHAAPGARTHPTGADTTETTATETTARDSAPALTSDGLPRRTRRVVPAVDPISEAPGAAT